MEFIAEYGLFLLKAITIVVALGIIIGLVAGAAVKKQKPAWGTIEVTHINDRLDEMSRTVKGAITDEQMLKVQQKEEKKAAKAEAKKKKQAAKDKAAKDKAAKDKSDKDTSEQDSQAEEEKKVYLVEFEGDIKASAVSELRETISAILMSASEKDEVVINLESTGGMVHSYGLAASQLDRIRQQGIPLTVCVDKVAASGGYMMACVANKICAAPFAIIGSIGVVAQLPNFHRLLKKNDIDFELYTAGEHKRTLTMFGENTDKGRQKFNEDLEETHELFKDFVQQQRPSVNVGEVATGEIWFGTKALEKQLVDEITTSDDYITGLAKEHEIYKVEYVCRKTLQEKLGIAVERGIASAVTRILSKVDASRFLQ